jgi:hypothetical protein
MPRSEMPAPAVKQPHQNEKLSLLHPMARTTFLVSRSAGSVYVRCCEGFRVRLSEGRRRVFGGRRPKASEEPRWGNVGRCRVPELSRDRTRKPAIWTRRP